jgi:hypothetical protein
MLADDFPQADPGSAALVDLSWRSKLNGTSCCRDRKQKNQQHQSHHSNIAGRCHPSEPHYIDEGWIDEGWIDEGWY